MLPKSRRALTIQEIAALARSSLHGISQVVKDHVTKPTAMAQGRVAHLIEWKGWCKPTDSPVALESDFNSYSDLTEGEQEARFAAGVAEQFAIAEAKLRAWSSVDGEDSNDESYDEDYPPNDTAHTAQTDTMSYPPYLRDLLHGQGLQPGGESGSPDALYSSLCSLEDLPLLRGPGGPGGPQSTPADLAAKILGVLQGLQRAECAFRSLGRATRDDSSCASCSESFLSPEEEELACEDYHSVCPGYVRHRRVSDVASSGVVSLDEEDEVEEEEDEVARKSDLGN